MQRYGQTGASSYGLIDNLTFTLHGNRVNRVYDAVTGSAYNSGFEFKDAVKQADEYAYDDNGNLTKDLNKEITKIQSNCLCSQNDADPFAYERNDAMMRRLGYGE